MEEEPTKEQVEKMARDMVMVSMAEESPIMVLLEMIAFHIKAGNVLKIWMTPFKEVRDRMDSWYMDAEKDFTKELMKTYGEAVGQKVSKRMNETLAALQNEKLFETHREMKADYYK